MSAISRWCRKDSTGGWHEIPTLNSAPKTSPRALSKEIVWAIIKKRTERKRCGQVIHQELLRDGINVSLSSVQRTLDRCYLLKKRSLWKKWRKPVPRPIVINAGDLVQVDTVHVMKDKVERLYVFTLIDLYSRWSYAKAYTVARAGVAAKFVAEAQKVAPFNFRHLQTDHGSEFSRYFKNRVGVKHRHSRVRKPNDNSHLERFNRTLREEFLNKLPVEIKTINKKLPEYLNYYNSQRLHMGINYQTPCEVLRRC